MNAYNYCILLVVGKMKEVKGVVAGHKIVRLEALGPSGAMSPFTNSIICFNNLLAPTVSGIPSEKDLPG